jgi:hypothetical protein
MVLDDRTDLGVFRGMTRAGFINFAISRARRVEMTLWHCLIAASLNTMRELTRRAQALGIAYGCRVSRILSSLVIDQT